MLGKSCSVEIQASTHKQEMILVGDENPGDHGGGTMQSQGDELSKDEASPSTVRGVGKRVAEIALRMAASAR